MWGAIAFHVHARKDMELNIDHTEVQKYEQSDSVCGVDGSPVLSAL